MRLHFLFFFTDPSTTHIYTLSLHDALPIFRHFSSGADDHGRRRPLHGDRRPPRRGLRNFPVPAKKVAEDRKSTRLNSSHQIISYAVFCLKKKKTNHRHNTYITPY